MKCQTFVAVVLLSIIVICFGCGPPPTAYEGRWVEQVRSRWEGTTDEYYSYYVKEFERQGPREFVFEGDTLTVSRQGQTSYYWFSLTEEMVPDEQGNVRPKLTLVLSDKDSYEETRCYLEKQGDDRILVWWPVSEEEGRENNQPVIIETREPVHLVRVAASE